MTIGNSETLLNIGFVDIGVWTQDIEKNGLKVALRGFNAPANEALLSESNALYAFCAHDGAVLYIGKTTQSLGRRFRGYGRPHQGQRTNWRCHQFIVDFLRNGRDVRVLVFPMSAHLAHLRYADFSINLAAGLEDSLIESFDPPWNGRSRGKPVTEDAEREDEIERSDGDPVAEASPDVQGIPFTIVLRQTYLDQGIINPGVTASRSLGGHDQPVRIYLGDRSNVIVSTINRRANSNGAARLIGNNSAIAKWFAETGFRLGDVVRAEVLDPNSIFLHSKVDAGS